MSGYTPSARQVEALAKLEAFAGLRLNRREFADRAEFQAYWDSIATRGDAAAKRRASETATERDARQERREARITAHYQDEEKLFAYACGYLARYQPASAKLRAQLVEKSGSAEVVEQVMARLAERLDDDARALELGEGLQRQGKNAQAIRNKLRQRRFSAESIERCLRTLTPEGGSLLDVAQVSRTVQRLERKGLSQRAMLAKLRGSAADGEVVAAAMAQSSQGDDPALRTALAKYQRKGLTGRALVQRLLTKGFRYADVTRIIAAQATE